MAERHFWEDFFEPQKLEKALQTPLLTVNQFEEGEKKSKSKGFILSP